MSGGAKYVVVDVSRARVRKRGEEVVEIDLGGKGKQEEDGVVFIQWRLEGGSIEVCEVVLPYSRCIGVPGVCFNGAGADGSGCRGKWLWKGIMIG